MQIESQALLKKRANKHVSIKGGGIMKRVQHSYEALPPRLLTNSINGMQSTTVGGGPSAASQANFLAEYNTTESVEQLQQNKQM